MGAHERFVLSLAQTRKGNVAESSAIFDSGVLGKGGIAVCSSPLYRPRRATGFSQVMLENVVDYSHAV